MTEPLPPLDLDAVTALQERAVGEAFAGLKEQGRILVEAPTGAGKTRINARTIDAFALDFEKQHGRPPKVLVLQHREAIARQGIKSFAQWNPDSTLSIGFSGRGQLDQSADVTFGIIDTVAAQIKNVQAPDLLAIDEVHHASDVEASRYAHTLDVLYERNPGMRLLTSTATPGRPDRQELHPLIRSAPHTTIGYLELERAGQIVVPETKIGRITMKDGTSLAAFVADRLDKRKGDLDGLASEIERNRPETFVEDVFRQWEHQFADRHVRLHPDVPLPGTLVFESSTTQAEAFAERARQSGVSVAVIDSKHSHDHNIAALNAYEEGRVSMIVSVKMLDEGIDLPRTKCVVVNRATLSEVEMHQMAGRAMRRGSDPALAEVRPLLLDMGASSKIHGAINERAIIIDYVQDLISGRPMPGIEASARDAITPVNQNSYSAWLKVNDHPPLYGITAGGEHLYAASLIPNAAEQRYTVIRVQAMKGTNSASVAIGADGKRMAAATEGRLRDLEKHLIVPDRQRFITREATGANERELQKHSRVDLVLDFLRKTASLER